MDEKVALKRKSMPELIGSATGGLMGVLLEIDEQLRKLEARLEALEMTQSPARQEH